MATTTILRAFDGMLRAGAIRVESFEKKGHTHYGMNNDAAYLAYKRQGGQHDQKTVTRVVKTALQAELLLIAH